MSEPHPIIENIMRLERKRQAEFADEMCPVPTRAERAANHRELMKLTKAERFALMFGKQRLTEPVDTGAGEIQLDQFEA